MEAATAPTPIRQGAKEAAGTEYVILQRVTIPAARKDPGKTPGASSTSRPAARARTPRSGSRARGRRAAFKAVPVRNWRGGLDLDTETREVTVSRRIQD
jgi:hypothetical protein